MNKLNKIAQGLAFTAALAASNAVFAAADGTLGATSSGDTDISLEIVDRVQITNMKDIALGSYSGSGAMVDSTSFCVYRNGGDQYQLTLTTDTGAFQLDSATTLDSIAFTTKVDADLTPADGAGIAYNTASAGMTGAGAVDCGGSDNASLEITFAEAALQAASTAADYQATMTVLVEPI